VITKMKIVSALTWDQLSLFWFSYYHYSLSVTSFAIELRQTFFEFIDG